MYDHTLFFACISPNRVDIMTQIKWDFNLVIANSHFNLPLGFVWYAYSVGVLQKGPIVICNIEGR